MRSSAVMTRSSCLKKSEADGTPPETLRNVSFSSGVLVREFDITMGDHPLNEDGLALTLDWSHAPNDQVLDLDSNASVRRAKFALPRRLSYDERRQRLFYTPPSTSALTSSSNLELASAIWSLQGSILKQKNQQLPPSPLELLQEEQDKLLYEKLKRKQSKIIQPPPMEIEWKRI